MIDQIPMIDPARLDVVRDLMDWEIVERHIQDNVDHRWACVTVADDLSVRLYFCEAPMGLWVAWTDAPDREIKYGEENLLFEAADGSMQSLGEHRSPWLHDSRSWMYASDSRCWASAQRDALIGACSLAIDSTADIFHSDDDLTRRFPRPVVQQLAAMERLLNSKPDCHSEATPGKIGSWDVDFHRISLLIQIAERAESLAAEVRRISEPLRATVHSEILRHRDAVDSGKISRADIPSPLSEDERRHLAHLFDLVMPIRDHLYFTVRAAEAISPRSPEETLANDKDVEE